LESFDCRDRRKRSARTQIRVFNDFVEVPINAVDGLTFCPLSVDDLLEIERRFFKLQRGIKLRRQSLAEPWIK
jgi:hypothetical protein